MTYPKKKLGDYIDILPGFAFRSKEFSDIGVPVIKNITPSLTIYQSRIFRKLKRSQLIFFRRLRPGLQNSTIGRTSRKQRLLSTI